MQIADNTHNPQPVLFHSAEYEFLKFINRAGIPMETVAKRVENSNTGIFLDIPETIANVSAKKQRSTDCQSKNK